MNLLHALFTRNLLASGVAIVRYIPRALRVDQVDGNLFFTEEKRQEYRRRVESVTPHSPRQWGTMEVDQIAHHLFQTLAVRGGSLLRSAVLLPGRKLPDFAHVLQVDSRRFVSGGLRRPLLAGVARTPAFAEVGFTQEKHNC